MEAIRIYLGGGGGVGIKTFWCISFSPFGRFRSLARFLKVLRPITISGLVLGEKTFTSSFVEKRRKCLVFAAKFEKRFVETVYKNKNKNNNIHLNHFNIFLQRFRIQPKIRLAPKLTMKS